LYVQMKPKVLARVTDALMGLGMKPVTRISWSVLVLAVVLAGAELVEAKEPIFDGLGSYTRTVTTNSARAQRYFNQGFAFYHGFNHGEAIRSFQEAARLDPKCAMAHWGIALASGPHINFPLVPPPAAELTKGSSVRRLIVSPSRCTDCAAR